jgi:DNA ligase-associated metallophosphoesterase
MICASTDLAGERLLLDPHGALVWPAERLLAVADLHFEKGSSAARHGSLLPPWDTRATLDRLAALIRRHAPRCVVALGDSFHDPHASGRLHHADIERLRALTGAVERFVWVRGNHDPRPPDSVDGEWRPMFQAGPLLFRHEAARGAGPGEVSGHYHPKAQVPVRGAMVTRPCFVCDASRLMLPALGAYAGGLDVRSPAIRRLFSRGAKVFLLGRDRLFGFPLAHLTLPPGVQDHDTHALPAAPLV